MKQTVVPAQVTTVEDKIAGNISFKQLLLLITPVFIGGAMYAFIPPFMGYASYKVVLWVILAVVCLSLAIRIKGRLVIEWLIVKGKYNLRPSQYVYNKNSLQNRRVIVVTDEQEVVEEARDKVISIDKVEEPRDKKTLQNHAGETYWSDWKSENYDEFIPGFKEIIEALDKKSFFGLDLHF